MEQQIINRQILDELKQIRIDIDFIKERLPEEEPLLDVEKQLEMGLEDMREGKIMQLA